MSIYLLKPKFQSLLRPCVQHLADKGVTANHVTIFAFILTLSSAALFFTLGTSIWWFFLPLILFIRMALNAIDGMLAREHNMVSPFGFVLNEVCDLISDAAIYLCFIAITGFHAYAIFVFVLLAWLSEVIAILSLNITQSRANQGPMGKSDRAFLFGLLGLLIAIGVDFSSTGSWVLLFAGFALTITIYRRLQSII